MRFAPNSFYIWFIGLTLAMVLASHALFMNYPGGWALAGGDGVHAALPDAAAEGELQG